MKRISAQYVLSFLSFDNCKRPAIIYLGILFCLIIKPQTGECQNTVYSVPGTYTFIVPSGVTSVVVQCWGGGGGGGGVTTSKAGGGGGGGGAYSTKTISVTAGSSYTVTVGAGGSGSTGVTGNAGGDSWFKTTSTVLAAGGAGGALNGGAGSGGAGGTIAASTGTTIYAGGNGANGVTGSSPNGYGGGGGSSAGTGAGGNTATSATGAIAPAGGGNGGAGATSNNTNGNSATTVGGGGGGAKAGANPTTGNAGGNGYSGQVIVSLNDASYSFRSKASGYWNDPSTWQSSPDGLTWYSAATAPTSSALGIEAASGNTITISDSVGAKFLTVDANGVLTYTGSGIPLTIVANGNFTINGRYELYGTQPKINNNAKAVINSGGEVRVIDNDPPAESDDFAWKNARVFFYTGALFSWYAITDFEIGGKPYFSNSTITDKPIMRINTNGIIVGSAATVINVYGKVEIASGDTVTLRRGAAKVFRDGIGGSGVLIHDNTCGQLQITSPTGVIDGTVTIQLQNNPSNDTALMIPDTAAVTISGSPTITVGTSSKPNAILYAGTVTHSGSNPIDFLYGKLVVGKLFTGTGKIKSGPLTDITVKNTGTATLYPVRNGYNYIHDFTINSGGVATLGDSLNATAGSSFGTIIADGTLISDGNLTLKSDADGTALVGSSNGVISGNVTVERHIPARRAWRFISAPFSSSTQTIQEAWQEEATPNSSVYTHNDPNPGYGTEITYDNNTANGFDVNITSNPSLKTWNQNTQTWDAAAPPTISTKITDYPAYCLFVRGSRAIDLSQGVYATPDNTVLRITGVLNETGLNSNIVTKSFTGNPGDYLLVSNPFASSIDLLSVLNHASSTGVVNNQFWVWDPKLSGSYSNYNVGGYVTYDNGIMTPSPGVGGSYTSVTTIMQSGQAFMVKLNNSSASLEFGQNDKSSSEIGVFGLRAKQAAPPPVIYANLLTSSAGSMALVDGVAAGFGRKFSASVDNDDAPKLWNFDENMALVRNENALAIEFRPIPLRADTLFFRLYLRQQPYTFQIFSNNLPADIAARAWIIDKYLNTQTEINLHDTTLYSFTPNRDTNSYRNRFMLVLNCTGGKAVIAKGKQQESRISKNGTEGRIYPNPVTSSNFNLILYNLKKEDYTVNIYSITGRLLSASRINYEEGNSDYSIKLPDYIVAGHYTVQVLNNSNNVVSSMPLIVNK